jgi:RHS repeat-associated protein
MLFGMIRAIAVAATCLVLELGFPSVALAGLPVISSFSPTSGVAQDVITINGSALANATVTFYGSGGNGVIVSASFSQIQVKVKADAKSGPITVTNSSGSATSHASFTVATPNITGISPSSAPVGATVTVTGTNFSTNAINDLLQFTGQSQWYPVSATVTAATSTSLTTTVPAGAVTGPLMLAVGTRSTTSSMNFTIAYPPVIASFTPSSGPPGTQVTISGSNFGATSATDTVSFNGVAAVVGAPSTYSTIYATVPAAATTGPITVVVNGLSATSSTNFVVTTPPPTVTGFSPASGPVGTSVTVNGTNFSATPSANIVTFNGTAATVTTATTTSLVALVPSGATTGPISVTVNGQSATSSSSFVVFQPPTISGFSPPSGAPGTPVTISGTNFSTTPSSNTVTFNGTSATVTAATATSLTVSVPAAASTGLITVTVNGLSASSSTAFVVTVPPPTITSFSPASGPVGTVVSVTGTNFSTTASANIVKFNGTTASVTASTTTSLTTAVPAGTTAGPITVTVGGQTAASASSFTVLAITTFTPTNGVVGDPVTISGTGFGSVPTANSVAFNGAPAIVGSNSTASAIYSWVPASATTGPIAVTVNGQTATSSNFSLVCPTASGLTVSTLAGKVGIQGSADGTGTAAQFTYPNGVTLDSSGNIFVADLGNALIRKVTPTGLVTTIAGDPHETQFGEPDGIVLDSVGNIYFTDVNEFVVRKLTPAGVLSVVAGTPYQSGTTDGTGSAARFGGPTFIALDSGGNLYVTDQPNNSIRKITQAGVVTTFAGLSGTSGSADGVGNAARFNIPTGIALDAAGNLIVADGGNNTIRKVTPSGVVTTIAGTVGLYGSADGLLSAATFAGPWGIATDKIGNIYVAEGVNEDVRKITPAGQVSTIAGLAEFFGSTDGVGSSARFYYPYGIVAADNGTLFVSDVMNGTIRTIAATPNCPAPATPTISVPPPTVNAASVNVSWTPGSGYITYFSLKYGTTNPPVTQVGGQIDKALNSYSVPIPVSGTYYFAIAACNPTTCSPYSTGSTVVNVPATIPNPPTSVTGSPTSSWNFTVSWTPSPTGSTPDYYKLHLQPSAIINDHVVGLSSPVTVTADGTYVFQVAACNNTAGCSAYTNGTVQISTPPLPPINLTATNTGGSALVQVSWASGGGGTSTRYQVERSPTGSGNWAIIGNPTAPSYTDSVSAGTYSYRVAACNAVCSAYATTTSGVVVTIAVAQPQLPPPATAVNDLPPHDATVGTMAGQAGTDGGAATYTVPIVVPPGRAGMQPSLSLNYNSRSGNGVMGVGWTLSGLSSIHRCPQTMEQDARTLGVSYSNNDRLCLDGQRLVPAAGYTYSGTAGTHYRTEIDSYSDIIQYGGDLGSSATYFVVQARDGRLLTYGQSSNAQVHAQGVTTPLITPLSWLVQQIQDRVGNNLVYSYTNYGNGEVLLASVTYTGYSPTSTAGNRTVTFAYQPRTNVAGVNDVSSSYLAGGLTMQTKALLSITTAVGGVTVRTYTPHYVQAKYSSRLLMASLTECAANGGSSACHSPTQFSYNDDPLNTSGNFPFVALNGSTGIPLGSSLQSATAPVEFHTIGDLDGDGTRETAVGVSAPSGGTEQYYLTQTGADRTVNTALNLTGTGFDIQPNSYVDIDGDGRSELIKTVATSGNLVFGAWKLGRGVAIPAGATYSTLFTDYSSNIPFGASDTFLTGDFDGDGRNDVVRVVQHDNSCNPGQGVYKGVYIYLNAMTGNLGSSGNTTAKFTVPSAPAFCLKVVSGGATTTTQAIDHIGDFNGDGLPDFYLRTDATGPTTTFDGVQVTQAAGTSVVPQTCGTAMGLINDPTLNSTTDVCTWAQHGAQTNYVSFMDVNGDGLEDIVLARPNQQTWRVLLNKGGTFGTEINTGSSEGLDTANGGFRYTGRLPTMDVDADGKQDLLVPSNARDQNGFSLAFAQKVCTIVTIPTFGTDNTCPLPNTNAPVTAPDASVPQTCSVYSCPQDPSGTLNMPAATFDISNYQFGWNGVPAFGTYDTNATLNPVPGLDNSVYHLSMLKFEQTGAAQFTLVRIETPLVARLSNGIGVFSGRADSLFGDGLADLTTVIGCNNVQITNQSGTINQCATIADDVYGPGPNHPLPDGTPTCNLNPDGSCYFDENPALYVGINEGVTAVGGSPSIPQGKNSQPGIAAVATAATTAPLAGWPTLPGLLYSSTNGLGDFSEWFYAPLSMGLKYQIDGYPGYSVNGTYIDSRHYYFASSMPIVYEMFQSTGIGTLYGFRGAAYDYSNAMYNHLGRGFQGFQSITTIVGNPTSSDNRVTDTITTYNQKFPLAGKVASVQVLARDLSGGTTHAVSQETDYWTCSSSRGTCPQGDSLPPQTGTAPYQPVLDSQIVDTYDLSTGALMAEVDTCNFSIGSGPCSLPNSTSLVSGWDAYGNLNSQTVTHKDKGAAGTLFLDSSSGHNVQTTNTYATPDTTNWWVNKLLSSAVTSSMTYSSGHTLPSGTAAPSQTLNTGYTWNADRTPLTKSVQSGFTSQQSTTTYSYPSPSYGLPTQIQINAPDLGAVLSPTRTTSFTYTKDGTTVPPAGDFGYFVLTTKNGLNQTTTTNHETNDGQVTAAIDPNGVQAITTYDAFGRATRVDHLGNTGSAFESPIQSAYTSCLYGCSGVGEDGNEANAAYRLTTVQAGYPTQVTWYDILGRSIKSAHAVYTGTGGGVLNYKFSATFTTYDDMGMVADQFPPYFVGAAPACFFSTSLPYCYISYTYDSLGRPVMKMGVGAELDPVHGDMETDYSYSGRKTNIVVHAVPGNPAPMTSCPTNSTTNLCLAMTRSTNALGQLMQTTESPVLTTGSSHLLQTNYWTEPQGHVVAITDAEGNITSASYNQLGQRTQSVDPDQGSWNFTYDALGELLTQTDARSVKTTVLARDVLGRTTQRQAAPTGGVLTGMANEATYDAWTFDPANGIGEVGSISRNRGSNLATPSSNPVVWQETYGYESTTARPTTTTTTISEGTSPPGALTSTTAYDTTAMNPTGHVVSRTYPSGLAVQNTYTAYGQLDALTNASTGYVYWAGLGQNQWSHTVKEQFPGVITGNYIDYNSTGQAKTLGWTGSTADQMTYTYDSFGNLTQQSRAAPYSNSESYTYDAVQRLTQTSRTSGNIVSYGYTDSGNIASKTDFGTGSYSYGAINSRTSGCGPHAVYAVGSTSYSCDANGNVISGSTLAMTFDPNNQARTANRSGSGSIAWAYDSLGERDYEIDTVERYFVGDGYRVEGSKKIHELGPVIVTRIGSTDSMAVSLRDRLGSTLHVIDNGFSTAREYDAFGKPRNGDMTDRVPSTFAMPDTMFGFTNHEHDDSVQLIHMKGRVFDYQLGRFLSVDPIIGNALSSQGLNPYSYISNNPLAGKDPTGYAAVCGDGGTECPTYKAATLTGSLIPGHNTGASVTFVNPSVGGAASVMASMFGMSHITVTGLSNGAVLSNASGAGGNTPSQQITETPTGSTPSTQSGQPAVMAAKSDDDLGIMAHYGEPFRPDPGAVTPSSMLIDAPVGDLVDYLNNVQQNGLFSKAAAIGLLGLGMDAVTLGKGGGGITSSLERSAGAELSPLARDFLSAGNAETRVYQGFRNEESVYAGISKDVPNRQLQHGDRFDIRAISPEMTRGQARAVEQALILRNPQYENIRNSISPTHEYYNDAVRWGETWLQENGH